MKVAEIKNEIQKLVETENNPDILNNVYEILEKAQHEARMKEAIIEGALKSEEDIKAGRVYSSEEFKKLIKDYIKQKR